jgi:hypothetical protein
MGFQKRVDRAGTVLQGVAQGFAAVRAGLDNLAEGKRFPRQCGTDGPTDADSVAICHPGRNFAENITISAKMYTNVDEILRS